MSDISFLTLIKTVHVIGAGTNMDRPAHKAFADMEGRGYRMVPVHPRDAGSTIHGRPIVPHPWSSEDPDLFVLFVSPDRTLGLLREWLISGRRIPFIWLQPGAERGDVVDFLEDADIPYSAGKCWVVTSLENNLSCQDPLPRVPWALRTTSIDGDECSVWNLFPAGTDHSINAPLEWVGDLFDLETSNEPVPRYIRSLVQQGETLEQAALRLS